MCIRDRVNVLTYEQVVVPLSQDGIVKPEWISNSINIAAKVWGLEDLRKVKPEDLHQRIPAWCAALT